MCFLLGLGPPQQKRNGVPFGSLKIHWVSLLQTKKQKTGTSWEVGFSAGSLFYCFTRPDKNKGNNTPKKRDFLLGFPEERNKAPKKTTLSPPPHPKQPTKTTPPPQQKKHRTPTSTPSSRAFRSDLRFDLRFGGAGAPQRRGGLQLGRAEHPHGGGRGPRPGKRGALGAAGRRFGAKRRREGSPWSQRCLVSAFEGL